MKPPPPFPSRGRAPRHGLARVLSKLGVCSRAEAWRLIQAGRVRVNGVVCRDPERPTDAARDKLEVDDAVAVAAKPVHVMLYKPRGLVTTTSDERGRATVYECLAGSGLPRVMPVGRLDQASEGLLLLTNDHAWAARLMDPAAHVEKEYHVQIAGLADAEVCRQLETGVTDEGEVLRARRVRELRRGGRNAWLEIVLDQGRNRQIRRMLAGVGFEVLRLVRVRVGRWVLGDLRSGQWRLLDPVE